MNCAAVENIRDLYLERRLSLAWASAVASHLRDCPSCARLAEAPQHWEKPQAPAGFQESLKKRIAKALAAQKEPSPLLLKRGLEAAPLLAAAALCVCLALLNWAGPGVFSQQDQELTQAGANP